MALPFNVWLTEENMKKINLTHGLKALVDDQDYVRLNKFKWRAAKRGNNIYAVRWGANREFIYMHRAIFNQGPGTLTDHRNGNGLDNRRANIRPVTPSLNGLAFRRTIKNKVGSRYMGVTKDRNKFRARIRVGGVLKNLGSYTNETEAHQVYIKAKREAINAIENKKTK